MAAPTNTVTVALNVGVREDLESIITRVAAEDTPFINNIGKVPVKNVLHEWQTETLATPDATNSALEGDDVGTHGAANLTTRVGNRTQIFTKSGLVSGTAEAVDTAGRDSEMGRQKLIKGKELMTDMEARFIGNYASVAESGATTRKSAGAVAWITSNDSRGAGGSDGGYSAGVVAAATNGTQRALTEPLLKAVLATAFANGARFDTAYMGGTHKQQWSGFTGIADIRVDAKSDKMATIIGAADVYVSDFGKITLVPHPYGLTRDVLLVKHELLAVGTLRASKSKALAVTGDNERFQIVAEKTLVVRNQKGLGVIADLT